LDQNALIGKNSKDLACVQGLVSYYDATQETGGLCIFLKSHLSFIDFCNRALMAKLKINFISLDENEEPLLKEGKGILVCTKAGDLILWDSRTIHCNCPGLISPNEFKEEKYEILYQISNEINEFNKDKII